MFSLSRPLLILIFLLGLLVFVAANTVFFVHETRYAVVFQFSEPKQVYTEPGAKFKLPFIQNVRYLNKRVQNLDPPAESFILADEKPLTVDYYLRYRITEPKTYLAVGSTSTIVRRMEEQMKTVLQSELSQRRLEDLLSSERLNIINNVREDAQARLSKFGLEILDVRIGKANLPERINEEVERRMEAERRQEAEDIRTRAEAAFKRVIAEAERERAIIVADAERQARTIRGEGEAQKTRILNGAYSTYPDFFAFLRQLEAYEKSLTREGTQLIISTQNPFFKDLQRGTANPPLAQGNE